MRINIPDDDILNQLAHLQEDAEEFQRIRSENRLSWLKWYRQEPYGNEVDGWSKVVSSAIWDAIQGLQPNLLERFTGDWFKLKSEDQTKSELNQKLVRYQLYQHNRFERILDHNFLYDVLNTEFAVLKAYYTEEYREGRQTISRMSSDEMAALQQNDKVEVVKATPVEEFNVSGSYWSGFEDIKIIVKEDFFKGLKIESVPGSEFYISSDAKDVETARLVEHRVVKSLDYVRKMEKMGVYRKGVTELLKDKVGRLEETESTSEETDDRITNVTDDLMGVDTTSDFMRPNAPIIIKESYVNLDLVGDGCLEPVVIASCADVILAIQENKYKRAPFFICQGFPMPHRIDGTSLGAILEHEQKEQTTLRRLMVDGVAQEMHQNMTSDDPTIVAALKKRTPRDVIQAGAGKVDVLPSPRVSDVIFKAMEHGQNAIEEKTPYSRMAQGSTDAGNALNKTASGMNMVLTSAARKERLLARRIARTLEDLIRFCLWVNEKIGPPIDYDKIIGLERQITPDDLFKDGEYDIEVVVGLGPQDKIEAARMLDKHVQFGVQAGLQLGVVTPVQIAETIRREYKLLDVPIEGLLEESEVIQQGEAQKQQQMQANFQQMSEQMKQMQSVVQKLNTEVQQLTQNLQQEKINSQLKEIEHKSEIKLLNMEKKNDQINNRAAAERRRSARERSA